MRYPVIFVSFMLFVCSCAKAPTPAGRPAPKPDIQKREEFTVFLGNTHAHSHYSGDAVQEGNAPSDHFRLAKEAGYDFYAVTDHSQYEQFDSQAWKLIQADADRYSDAGFIGIRGYEHSENNGPGAKGHLNVYGTSDYLNALDSDIDMRYFHDWLSLPVNSSSVVSMNHPSETQYDDFHCYNEAVKSKITLIELINGPKCDDYYPSYLIALKKGWKVSPVAGADFHNLNKIGSWEARTGLAARSFSKEDLQDAMRNRRTYATYDKTLKLLYYVDDNVMGSTFSPLSGRLIFDVAVSSKENKITRIEICTEDGVCVKGQDFRNKDVEWKTEIDKRHNYYFVNVYAEGRNTPTAYAAPVWLK